jgi:hypothetical protein
MRFRRIFGPEEVQCSPAQLMRLRRIWTSLAVQLTRARCRGDRAKSPPKSEAVRSITQNAVGWIATIGSIGKFHKQRG